MIEALITVGALAAYGLIGSVIGALFRAHADDPQHGDTILGASIAGFIWPAAGFILLGGWFYRLFSGDRLDRKAKARLKSEAERKQRDLMIRRLEIEAGVLCPHGQEPDQCYRSSCYTRRKAIRGETL